jgi:8-oxo-dGTP diphosphatase
MLEEKNADGTEKRPLVGVGIMIENDQGGVLLGLRKGGPGSKTWSFPGGHLEFGETIFETARREVAEETGLSIRDFSLVSVVDDLAYVKIDGKHYLTLGVRGTYEGGEPRVMEPDKCERWEWFPLDALPENLFKPTAAMLKNVLEEKLYQEGL